MIFYEPRTYGEIEGDKAACYLWLLLLLMSGDYELFLMLFEALMVCLLLGEDLFDLFLLELVYYCYYSYSSCSS